MICRTAWPMLPLMICNRSNVIPTDPGLVPRSCDVLVDLVFFFGSMLGFIQMYCFFIFKFKLVSSLRIKSISNIPTYMCIKI